MFPEASCVFIQNHPAAVKLEISGKLLCYPGFRGRSGSSVPALQAQLLLACVSWGKRGELTRPLIIPALIVLSLQDVPGPWLRLSGNGQFAPPLMISVLSTGTCTTTESKAWEPTALMGCTAWKLCESSVFFSVLKSSCVFIPSANVRSARRKGQVSLGQPHWVFTLHRALKSAPGLAPDTSPASRSPGHDVPWGGGRLDFLPLSVQAGLAVLLLQRGLRMWVE